MGNRATPDVLPKRTVHPGVYRRGSRYVAVYRVVGTSGLSRVQCRQRAASRGAACKDAAVQSWPPTIGQLLPRAADAHGVEGKLRAYSLNPEHEIGTHKARVFRQALGVGLDDVEYLVEQLLAGIGGSQISDVRDSAPHGLLCEVVVTVRGIGVAAGRTVPVTTSWEYRSPEDAPRLVSAYIES